MAKRTVAPYGSWKSPISAEMLVQDYLGLGGVMLDGSSIYWTELRPAEQGRNALVRLTPDGEPTDVTLPRFNARTRVHEYGGGTYIPVDGVVYFSNYSDQLVYRVRPGEQPEPITTASGYRYADFAWDRRRRRLIAVREDHTQSTREATNTLVALDPDGNGPGRVLNSGCDFYSSPAVSPDGSQLAWLSWNHPNMPWDGTELWVARIAENGSLGEPRLAAGGLTESLFQPAWSPRGVLHFVSDRTGWWNLYRWQQGKVEALYPMDGEFALPQWLFGWTTYGFEGENSLICMVSQSGENFLARLDTRSRTLDRFEVPDTLIRNLRVDAKRAVYVGGSPTELPALISLDLATGERRIIRRSQEPLVDRRYISVPEALEFPTAGGQTAHAFFYPPANSDFAAPEGDLPPLIVMSHGGPTSATTNMLNYGIQFWTSRGFAVADVNYGGSTGYGREYRDRLKGQWGIVDVDDCSNVATYLAEQARVDPKRLIITGGSAGGFTTFATLAFRDVFTAGSSHFGVSDLEALAKDTHKFESRYLDGLVGPYPQRRDLYVERSPIHHTHKLNTPLILFQGLEDVIVPPSQSRLMFEAVRSRELPVALIEFEGEQHGFRRKENIIRAKEAELYFYSKVFGFDLPEPVEPVEIENLD